MTRKHIHVNKTRTLWCLQMQRKYVLNTDGGTRCWKMSASTGEVTWSALLSIPRSQANLKGHELTPNFLAPAGFGCSFRLGLRETEHWAPLLINVFSAGLQPAQKPHVGVDLLALNPYFLFLSVFTANETFRRKDADIDWLVATLFWVAFHKWSRLLKK